MNAEERFKGFAYKVSIDVTFTQPELRHLLNLSASHYNGVCKNAGQPGGFIYGWMRQAEVKGFTDEVPATVTADARQLDTCAKILEQPTGDGELYYALKLLLRKINTEAMRLNG